jgi:hypothetical protein
MRIRAQAAPSLLDRTPTAVGLWFSHSILSGVSLPLTLDRHTTPSVYGRTMPTIVDKPRSPYFSQHVQSLQQQVARAGRPKGKQSRPGVSIRKAIEQVFGAMGSWEGMMAWAKDNPDTFYGQVVPKLLPTELAESGLSGHLTIIVQRGPAAPEAVVIKALPLVINSLAGPAAADEGGPLSAGQGAE